MNTLKYNRKTYTAPESWKECTQKQIAQLIVFCRIPRKEVTEEMYEMAVQLAYMIPEKAWHSWIMTRAEWAMLKDSIDWVFSPPEDRPFESFVHYGQSYILPEENFANTTALELSMAFIAYTDFIDPDEPDTTALDRLISTLCRPARKDLVDFKKSEFWTGDDREAFNEARMMQRATLLAFLPMEIKVVILTYFEMQAKAFLAQYEQLFGGDSEPRYADGRGWIMLLKNIAKEGHFGDFDNVGKQYAHLVYAAALDDTITAEEIRNQNDDNGYEY